MRTLGLTLREIHLNFEKKNIKMVRKKIDNRIRVMIENGITLGHRTMFAVVGDKAKDQVVILHHMVRTCFRANCNTDVFSHMIIDDY